MMKGPGAGILGILLGLLVACVRADQIVYLERPGGGPTWEPFFNPKTINAAVGEKVAFVARFSPIVQDSTTELFVPLNWGFSESNFTNPCTFNDGAFSGFFYVDPPGTANGSSFTMTVTSTQPRFFQAVRLDDVSNCSASAGWASHWGLPSYGDIIFALNPSADQSLTLYKSGISKAVNTPITFSLYPQGGQLRLKSNNPLVGSNATVGSNTTVVTITPTPDTGASNTGPTGFSGGTLAGAIIGAFLGGLIWGALGTIALKRTRQKVPYHDTEDTDELGWPNRRPNTGTGEEEPKGEEVAGVRESAIMTGGRLGHEPPISGRTINQASLPSPI